MNFDPGLEQLRGDQATFESAQELSHIFSYNLRPKKLFLVWVDFPALCLKVANCDMTFKPLDVAVLTYRFQRTEVVITTIIANQHRHAKEAL